MRHVRSNADKRRDVLVLLRDATRRQCSNRELARQAGVHHQLVGRLRGGVAMDDSSREPHTSRIATRQQAHPSPRTPLLMGEVLSGCGLSPACIQRLHSRGAVTAPRQAAAGRAVAVRVAPLSLCNLQHHLYCSPCYTTRPMPYVTCEKFPDGCG